MIDWYSGSTCLVHLLVAVSASRPVGETKRDTEVEKADLVDRHARKWYFFQNIWLKMGRRKQIVPKKSDNLEDQDPSKVTKNDEGSIFYFCDFVITLCFCAWIKVEDNVKLLVVVNRKRLKIFGPTVFAPDRFDFQNVDLLS